MIEETAALGLLSPLSCTYVRTVVSSIMYICVEILSPLSYVHDRGDNTPTHMYMIEETMPQHMYMIEEITALTYVHDRGDSSPNICT
jgi:hypothetical protein